MRRPAQTKSQRAHAKQQRAVRALLRAAVRYSMATDAELVDGNATMAFLFADLTIACDRVAATFTARELRKIAK